jgi:hypothetical protein
MRVRAFALTCALALLGGAGAASMASAAPRSNRNLTIAAAPDPVVAGKAVVIYGRLVGGENSRRTVRLFHHLIDGRHGYRPVAATTTDSSGYYEFVRPQGVVYTNRDWFVRGPDGAHSATIEEKVIPLVSLEASTASTDTNHAILFTGHVIPNHRFERVFLQQQIGSSDDWRTLRSTTLGPGSRYFVAYRWRRPGMHDVRVLFRGDARNLPAASDPVTVTVQQAQVPGFTIGSSAPMVDAGGSVTISGRLDRPGTDTPEPNTVVQLWGRAADQPRFTVLADAVTAADGSYSFGQSALTTNTTYFVATMPLPGTARRHTARLYQGVRDMVTMQASSSSATTGQTVTFSGTVLPDKAGHVVYLQTLGGDGDWHTVQLAVVGIDSTFQFTWSAGSPGLQSFRARITGDEDNVGAASDPVSITVSAPSSQQ